MFECHIESQVLLHLRSAILRSGKPLHHRSPSPYKQVLSRGKPTPMASPRLPFYLVESRGRKQIYSSSMSAITVVQLCSIRASFGTTRLLAPSAWDPMIIKKFLMVSCTASQDISIREYYKALFWMLCKPLPQWRFLIGPLGHGWLMRVWFGPEKPISQLESVSVERKKRCTFWHSGVPETDLSRRSPLSDDSF